MAGPEEREPPVDGIGAHEIGDRTYIVADVKPLDVDGTRTVALGTALWAVAFVTLLPFRGRLASAGLDWWLWTCLAGVVFGAVGWGYCHRHRSARRSREAVERTGDQAAS